MNIKEGKWEIKLKIVDKKARRKKKKFVLYNLNMTVTTGWIKHIFRGISDDLHALDMKGEK